MNFALNQTPFEILLEYERLAQAHVAGSVEQAEAPGLWRGIGFRLARSHFISSITEVSEILVLPPMTLIPGVRSWLLGVSNIRGNLVSIVDLRGFVLGERAPITDKSRVLIAKQQGGAVGLLVDEVLGQRTLTDEHEPSDQTIVDDPYARYISKRYDFNGVLWGVFSMGLLVKAPDFIQAAA